MRGFVWAVMALGASACGNVATANDAKTGDAPDPDALVCTLPQLACGTGCIDVSSNHDHCGSCDLACTDAEDCISGHCTDTTASCAAVHQFTPTVASGEITHKADGTKFFCDVATGLQYDELSYGQFDVVHNGFTIVSPTDLQNDTLQKAFIYLFNKQHGLDLIAVWTDTNCCFKGDTVANNSNMMFFHAGNVTPAKATNVGACNVSHTDNPAHFIVSQTGEFSPDPMPPDYFTTNPVTPGTQCLVGANPAFFWRRH